MSSAIVLFTRDLRISDNPALPAASRAESLVAVFARDPRICPRAPRRAGVLDAALAGLDRQRRSVAARLIVIDRPAEAALPPIADQVDAWRQPIAADVSPFAKRRETAIRSALGRRRLVISAGITIVEPGPVALASRSPYRVFTAYHQAWLRAPRRRLLPTPTRLRFADTAPASVVVHATAEGEPQARARRDAWLADGLARYRASRARRALDATSRLSAAMHGGVMSPLEVARRAGDGGSCRQLAWRDFHHQLRDAGERSTNRA
jgi:deoxyribodipyrimidine photo-lyase